MKSSLKNFVDAGYKKKSEATNVNGYILDKDLSTKRDKVYYDPNTGKVIHTIAGTDSLKDWSNNALIPIGMHQYSNRYKNAENIQKKANEKYGKENVSLVTHSQSGNIAESLANKNLVGGDNTTLNPAIIGSHNKNIKVVKSVFDPVSLLTNTNKKDMLIMPKTFNPITEHSTNILDKTKNIFGFGIKKTIKKKNNNKEIEYMSDSDSDSDNRMCGGAIHEQDIINKIGELSHKIKKHHSKYGKAPIIKAGIDYLKKHVTGKGMMSDLYAKSYSKEGRKAIDKYGIGGVGKVDLGIDEYGNDAVGSGIGRRNKYNKWVDTLGARDLIEAGMKKGATTIGSGVGRRNKYNKWVDTLGARDLIEAGMNKGATTIGSGVGRRNKYNKWVDTLGARDLIDAGMKKGETTIGSGVGRRNKYNKWVDTLGARDLIEAGMNKGATTIGSGFKMPPDTGYSNWVHNEQATTRKPLPKKFTGTGVKSGRFVKGSQAAKDHMARIRAMKTC
jgi:hypothetical protein